MNSLNQRIDQLERALRATGPVATVVTPTGHSSIDNSTPASADSLGGAGNDATSAGKVQTTSLAEGMLVIIADPL